MMSEKVRLLVLIILISGWLHYSSAEKKSNPLKDPYICGRPQCEELGKFKYLLNQAYKYDYSMYVKTNFAGTGENTSELHLTASVEIIFPKKCEGILKINTVEVRSEALSIPVNDENDEDYDYQEYKEVEQHPKSEEIREEIERYDIRFAFHDGVINEVCPNVEESIWALNLKKGILSSFQNTMPRFDIDFNTTETDVSGICDVKYRLSGAKDTSLLIHKIKDISSCRNRHKTHSILQSTPYDFRENYVAWPVLKSTSYCNVSIDDFVYKGVLCYEHHQLVPLSQEDKGAVTETLSKLILADSESGSFDDDGEEIELRSSLLYDHTPTVKQTHTEIKASREFLKQMCRQGFPDIQRNFTDVFLNFLSASRLLSYSALNQLLTRADSICVNGKNHVLESLPYIASSASVLIMKDEIVRNQITTETAHTWMESLSYLPRPDEDVLNAMYELIEHGQAQNDYIFMLTASAVTHTFCKNYPDCYNNEYAKAIIDYLEADLGIKLAEEKPYDRQTKDNIILILKALGNIGQYSDETEEELEKMIENEAHLIEIRLQAIHAFRRYDCGQKREYFLKIFSNFQENTEIRIAAYLQSMRCPDFLSIKIIKNILKTEKMNQVGSFVWSHLTNLAKSASPVKVEVQGLLMDNDLGAKYKMDFRKFSRNYEYSLFFDEYNFGVTTDNNIIFGTESYLPRTASFNLTADLFGESVNFFEFNARAEGFEQQVESIFGPKGFLNVDRFKEQFEEFTKYFRDSNLDDEQMTYERANLKMKKRHSQESVEKDSSSSGSEEEKQRKKRDIYPLVTTEELEEKVDQIGYDMKYKFDKPKASFGIKVFGNDLRYYSIEGMQEVGDLVNQFTPTEYLSKFFAKDEVSYTKSGIFLDTAYVIPMTTGLPLSLSILGASSIDLRLSGKLRELQLRTKSADIEGKIKTSISVDIISTMQTDFMHTATGIKVKGNMYSNSALEAKLKVRGWKFASLQFSLPQEENKIFSIRSEMLVMKHTKLVKQKGIPLRYTNSTCTWPVIDSAIGLKLCSIYSLPDVSKSNISHPSLLLSGPITLDINLNKADPSAKTFVFQYQLENLKNVTKGSIIFETPGSKIPRIFTANITNDIQGYNILMGFKNGDIVHSATVNYFNRSTERCFDISLNANDKKYFSMEMGYNVSTIRNGFLYYPTFFLTVNKEKIAGLAGTIKYTSKNLKSQYDVNLKFETKKLEAHLNGYITKSEASHTGKLAMNYRFASSKQEIVEFDWDLADRSYKGRTEYTGAVKLKSSAYPKLNFASNSHFLLSHNGHVEAQLQYNNAADLTNPKYTTTIRIMFAKYQEKDIVRTTFSTEIRRPNTRTDYKFTIKHEEKSKRGTEHNILILTRYAPQKEITSIFSVHIPKLQVFAIDIAMNITVPSFESLLFNLWIKQKDKNDYNFHTTGTWFSGHSIDVKGLYQDRSSFIKKYYHLKFVAQSPSFDEVNADLKYIRDEYDFRIEIVAEYAKQPYAIIFRKRRESETLSSTHAELKYKEKVYWLHADMNTDTAKQLHIDIHIDKIRDINLILRGYSIEEKREIGVEIKWDANRDPTQKLAVSAEFNSPRPRSFNGGFLITYPDRSFSGTFAVQAISPNYLANARISWSPTEAFEVKLNAGTSPHDLRNMWLSAKIITPFDGWRQNGLNGGFYYADNLLNVNSSIFWADNQKLGFEIMGLYRSTHTDFIYESKTKLISTLQNVPTVKLYLKHKQEEKRVETDFLVNHTTGSLSQITSMKSIWNFDFDNFHKNLSGSVVVVSPFEGYSKAAVITRISLSESKALQGAADVEIEDKKYTMLVEGYIRKLIDNMLSINITTPMDRFKNIIGRFGINDKDKHIVAEAKAPAGALGIEILFNVLTTTSFDVKFSLATPLEAVEKVTFIGKLKPDNVDFRAGMNKIILGFIGVWRNDGTDDFEYSYLIFTPLEKFENNGFVAKVVNREYLDTELSFKFAAYKLGIKIQTEEMPEALRELKAPIVFDDLLSELDFGEGNVDEENEYEDEEIEDQKSFLGYIEIDTIVWPTISGSLDYEEIGYSTFISGELKVPQGIITIRDHFYLEDYLNIKNNLKIITPFHDVKEIKSAHEHRIKWDTYYIFGTNLHILNVDKWIKTGYRINQTISTDETDVKIYENYVDLMTPLELLPKVKLQLIIELEDNLFRGNLTGKTLTTDGSIAGVLELEDSFAESQLNLWLKAPLVPFYSCKLFYKHDFSEIENSLGVGLEIVENTTINKLSLDTSWQTSSSNYVNAKAKLLSTLTPLRSIDISTLLTKTPNPTASLEIIYIDHEGISEEIKAKAKRNNELVSIDLSLPISEYKNISAYGTLEKTSDAEAFKIKGSLYRNFEAYNFSGTVNFVNDVPMKIDLKIADEGIFLYKVKQSTSGTGFDTKIAFKEKYAQITGNINVEHKFSWNVEAGITSSESSIQKATLQANMKNIKQEVISGLLDFSSPWKHYGIDTIKFDLNSNFNGKSGLASAKYVLSQINGESSCSWSWVLLENMHLDFQNTVNQNSVKKHLSTGLRYIDPKQDQHDLIFGADLNVNNLWVFSGNGSLQLLSMDKITAGLNVLLPKPVGDLHRLHYSYAGNLLRSQEHKNIDVIASYITDESKKRYAIRSRYNNLDDIDGLAKVEWGLEKIKSAEGSVELKSDGPKKGFFARLATPYHTEGDTLQVKGSLERTEVFNIVSGTLFYPEDTQFAEGNIAFESLSNMKGSINSTTPFLNITWLRGDFDFDTTEEQSTKYLKASWPESTAILDAKSTYSTHENEKDSLGTIKIEVPLQTRHFALITYGLKEKQDITSGHAEIEYNSKNVLKAQYTSKSEFKPNYGKETVDITLQNEYKPLGVKYIHHIKKNGENYIELDTKRAELFEPKNRRFNITAEVRHTLRNTGQEYVLTAMHPNRTVVLTSDYDYYENVTKQMTKLQLAPNVWIAYNLKLQNKNSQENVSQAYSIGLSYPSRNISAEGWYAYNDYIFDSDLELKYTPNNTKASNEMPEPKVVKASLKWKEETQGVEIDKTNQTLSLVLGHPTFEKDVSFHSMLFRDSLSALNMKIVIDYSNDESHLLTLGTNFTDKSGEIGYKNYTFIIEGMHESSDFDLLGTWAMGVQPNLYEVNSDAHYKRGYLPLQEATLTGFVNLDNKEFFYHKNAPDKTFKYWGKYDGKYPVYSINGSVMETPEFDMSGTFFMDIDDKLVKLEVNMTPDASQNLQMHGFVPDARSIHFDLWRDYDDIRVIDVAYYLKLNHSRLVTSQLLWRPNLKSDISDSIWQFLANNYDQFMEDLDYWVKTIYTESLDTIEDVRREAKPFTQGFLDDVGGLNVIQGDLEKLFKFLNESYNADDFYVRSVVNFTVTILDELAIKNHIASVPKILTEIWQVMGQSGKAMRESIEWLIDTIKASYGKAAEAVGKILHGESFSYFSKILEKVVAKYDKFIKDLHLSFIKYIQNIWTKFTTMLSDYWSRLLKNIEPSIIKLVHYAETLVWNLSQELFDFLYKRTNDLAESPYFNQVSNFTQDLDRLYKDMVGNDAITNIKKYSALLWKFAKDKYFKMVPFAKESNQLFSEIWDEIRKLQKLEYVEFVVQRVNEIVEKMEWLADEFQVERRLQQLWTILQNKLARFAQTALQADNRYRTAKTKFVFDPDTGIIELEQKLPMSWHAFNETPKFEEIPEYKTLADMQKYFTGTNISLWSLFYEYRPYLDPNMWLPPFKAHSLLIGSRHYMTFDRRFVSLNLDNENQCSYLLAHDFVQKTFTLMLDPSDIYDGDMKSRKLTILSDGEIIEVDIIDSAIRIGQNITTALPSQIGDTVIYRETDLLIIESSKGFWIRCNLQFYVCSFDLSGWYYGKTSGILGSMNNELYDDLKNPDHSFSADEEEFINNWALPTCDEVITSTNFSNNYRVVSNDIHQLCDSFFKNKLSYFVSCFPMVKVQPFYEMCIDLGLHYLPEYTAKNHPTNKGACTAALAYIEACALEMIPLRVPENCVHCDLINGSYVAEGSFVNMRNDDIPRTADIVFIVEAKTCNENITTTKSMLSLVQALHKELNDRNINDERYAVVTFGGLKPFDKPRSVVVNNKVFVDYEKIGPYFDHIKTNNGTNKDTFDALSAASKLIFRPGASKTFILLPCSECASIDMNLDYSSLLQLMLENGISLHILMDQDFAFDKGRANKLFYGMDRDKAYTKKDLREFKGDIELRKQVRLPKSALGICTPLAIETNGTIFWAKKLRPDKRNPVKKFASVFARRVALSAEPVPCQICECTGHNTGVAYMICNPCDFPSPYSFGDDSEFNEDSMLSSVQSEHDWMWEEDDDQW